MFYAHPHVTPLILLISSDVSLLPASQSPAALKATYSWLGVMRTGGGGGCSVLQKWPEQLGVFMALTTMLDLDGVYRRGGRISQPAAGALPLVSTVPSFTDSHVVFRCTFPE